VKRIVDHVGLVSPRGFPMSSQAGWGSLRAASGVSALLALVCLIALAAEPAVGQRRGPKIPDDLHDVVDDEEDDDWKSWGRTKRDNPPDKEPPFEIGNGPIDMSKVMNQQKAGPQLTFARLRPDPTRTKEEVDEIGMRWSALLRTGGMADQIYPIDEGTILISIIDGKYMDEIKKFVLTRDEAYEFEWKNQKFRRPGDPELKPEGASSNSNVNAKPEKKKPKKSKKNSKKKQADEL